MPTHQHHVNVAPEIQTERLLLRRWRADDLGPFAAINADARVMEHFPATLSVPETEALIERVEACFSEHGYGLWVVQPLRSGELIGFVGLYPVPPELPFAPAVEIGWRLAHAHWGQGYATEAATAALAFGFQTLCLEQIVSFTAVQNTRSQALMQRLGMARNPSDDFEHPLVPHGHRLRAHVLYRLDRPSWLQSQ